MPWHEYEGHRYWIAEHVRDGIVILPHEAGKDYSKQDFITLYSVSDQCWCKYQIQQVRPELILGEQFEAAHPNWVEEYGDCEVIAKSFQSSKELRSDIVTPSPTRTSIVRRLLHVFRNHEQVPDSSLSFKLQVFIKRLGKSEMRPFHIREVRCDHLGRRITILEIDKKAAQTPLCNYVIRSQLPAGSSEISVVSPRIKTTDMLYVLLQTISSGDFESVIQPFGDIRSGETISLPKPKDRTDERDDSQEPKASNSYFTCEACGRPVIYCSCSS